MQDKQHHELEYIDNHWWFASRTRALNCLMRQVIPASSGLRLLDIGCGGGNMIHHLAEYGEVVGLEIDARPVKVANERGYNVQQFDATYPMPYTDHSFDAITALDVIEHNEDDMAILRDSYRLLKPGGYIIITVPAFMFLWSHNDDINAHVRRYTAGELDRKLQETGFDVWRISYNNFFVFPLAAVLLTLRRTGEAKPDLASHHVDEDEYQVEMEPASPLVNTILTGVGQVEAELIERVNLPVGTSLIAIARKPLG
ncbi:methyltransferase domain-containing protein [Anaerolineales bacterium HSG6]|nr:methyltransferase domain-containing protein [Anaerolineales bacterium HSG6]MDM8532357.1 methyltransferase domain-containing protein [Anaerolineales bacterium HSG25]